MGRANRARRDLNPGPADLLKVTVKAHTSGRTMVDSTWRAHPDLNQGPADLQSAALATELCTQVLTSVLERRAQLRNAMGVHVEQNASLKHSWLQLLPNLAFFSSASWAANIVTICDKKGLAASMHARGQLAKYFLHRVSLPEWLRG